MHELFVKLQPALIDFVALLVIALLGMGTAWIRAHTKNLKVSGTIDRITLDIDALVAEQAQLIDTFRGDDGKLSLSEALRAKEAVLAGMKKLLGPTGLERLKKDLDLPSVDEWLSSHIEKSVRADETATGQSPPLPSPAAMPTATEIAAAMPSASDVAAAIVTADIRKPQGGFVDRFVIIGMALIAMLFVGGMACGWLKKETKAIASSIIDCTKGEASKAVHELGPVVDAVLTNAIDRDSKVDWNPIRDLTKSFTADIGGCVLSDAISRALAPKPDDPNAPKASPLEVDAAALRADFAAFKLERFPGRTFKTEHGEL